MCPSGIGREEVGDVRAPPRMNDRPAASIADWFASDAIPASATTVTSGSWCAAMNALITGTIVWGLGAGGWGSRLRSWFARSPRRFALVGGAVAWP
jgi:hypothetical protein